MLGIFLLLSHTFPVLLTSCSSLKSKEGSRAWGRPRHFSEASLRTRYPGESPGFCLPDGNDSGEAAVNDNSKTGETQMNYSHGP